ncbi:unnamed protein product, partial [Chrysoparadoxa australica]
MWTREEESGGSRACTVVAAASPCGCMIATVDAADTTCAVIWEISIADATDQDSSYEYKDVARLEHESAVVQMCWLVGP